MKKSDKVVIIGGGFAGARVAQDLVKQGLENILLIDRKDYFEVTYAMLRGLVNPEFGAGARVSYAQFLRGDFRHAEVDELTSDAVILRDGTTLPFDIVVVATGSSYPTFPIAKSAEALMRSSRDEEIIRQHAQLAAAKNVVIVGGGPVGVELAGEIAGQFSDKAVTLVEGGPRLLPELKAAAGEIAAQRLTGLGVKIVLGKILSPDASEFSDADIVYTCVGLRANTGFMISHFAEKLDPTGRINVDRTMRVVGTRNIFALGDCSNLTEAKMGYLADMQGALLAKNIAASANGKSMKPFKPLPMMALVPIGAGQGVAQMPLLGVTTLKPIINMKQKDMFIARQFGNLGHKV